MMLETKPESNIQVLETAPLTPPRKQQRPRALSRFRSRRRDTMEQEWQASAVEAVTLSPTGHSTPPRVFLCSCHVSNCRECESKLRGRRAAGGLIQSRRRRIANQCKKTSSSKLLFSTNDKHSTERKSKKQSQRQQPPSTSEVVDLAGVMEQLHLHSTTCAPVDQEQQVNVDIQQQDCRDVVESFDQDTDHASLAESVEEEDLAIPFFSWTATSDSEDENDSLSYVEGGRVYYASDGPREADFFEG